MVAQVLNIVLNIEPLVHLGLIKVHAVGNLNLAADEILSLNINQVRNLIIFMSQEDSANEVISSLGATSAHLELFHSLVIIQHYGLGTANNLALAILGNNIHSITGPNINTHNTIQLVIQSDSTGLGVGSAARDICLSFQVCQSGVQRSGSHKGEAVQVRLQALLNSLFGQIEVVSQNLIVAGIPQLTLSLGQLTLDNNFSAGVRQIHRGALYSRNLAGQTIHNVAAFTFGNGNCVMSNLIIIVDNSMFRTRIINHLVVASDEQLFAHRMNSAIVILILSDYLNIDAGNLRQLNRTEHIAALGGAYEALSGLGEHNLGTMDVALVAIFILQNTILQTLQSNSITDITIAIIVVNSNNFNTSRRNVEGNFSALNDQNLAIYIIALGLNNIAFGITNLALVGVCAGSLIDASQQILVRAQSMTSDNLCHLARIQGKGLGTANINLLTDQNIFGQSVRGAGLGMLIILNGILQDSIPVLRNSGKQILGSVIRALNETLGLGVKPHQFIRLRQRHLGGANQTRDMALSFVQNISIFVDRQNKVFLIHFTHKLCFSFSYLFFYNLYFIYIL